MANFDPYHKWLGIPPKDQPPHHYRLLGLELYESDADVIDSAANRLMSYLQQCATGKQVALSQKLLNEVAAARVCLLSNSKKTAYDAKLKKKLALQAAESESVSQSIPVVAEEPTLFDLLNREPDEFNPEALDRSIPRTRVAPSRSTLPAWIPVVAMLVGVLALAYLGFRMTGSDAKSGVGSTSAEDDSASDDGGAPSVVRRPRKPKQEEDEVKSATPPPRSVPKVSNTPTTTRIKPPITDPKPTFSKKPELTEITNQMGMTFVLLPKGEFMMGSADAEGVEAHEQPRHRVTISRPFFMSKFETTSGEFDAVMLASGNTTLDAPNPKLPASEVTWDKAVEFCRYLSRTENRHYRLPTEAEWEYACRAGASTTWSFGDSDLTLAEFAWLDANSEGGPHAVGTRQPNAWKLHDMHGNVSEWCYDTYSPDFYASSRLADPVGPPATPTATRLIRGGNWDLTANAARSAARAASAPDATSPRVGFRVVMEAADFGEPLSGEMPSSFIPAAGSEETSPKPGDATPTTPKTPARPSNIPVDASFWKGNWYWCSPDKASIEMAGQTALRMKGRLVLIRNQEENDFVASIIPDPTWIGCGRINGRWINSMGQAQKFFVWDANQPSGGLRKNYVGLHPDGTWHDYAPDRLHFCVEWGTEN